MASLKKTKPNARFRIRRQHSVLRFVFIALAMLLLSPTAYAQESAFVLDGKITLHNNDEGGAIGVRLYQEDLVKETFTDPQGNYIFRNVVGGTYRLTATFPGYNTHEEEITVNASQTLDRTLFGETTVALSIGVTMSGAPIDTVEARLHSGSIANPEDGSWMKLDVVDDEAIWEVDAMQGNWVLDVKADGYEPHTTHVALINEDTRHVLAIHLVEASTYDVRAESTCQSTPFAPRNPNVPLLILASLALFIWRKQDWSRHAL